MIRAGVISEGRGMKRTEQIAFACAALAVTAAAMASETISYTYDARGRLVKVERTGTVNNGTKAEYQYDKGDNRTNVNVIVPN
jgi:coenzyme F420-reducing hydrogenase delta subunit